MVEAIESGEVFVSKLLADMFGHIGDAIVNMAYLLNPQVIFLPRWTSRVPECTLDVVRLKLGSYGLSNWRMKTEVRPSQCKEEHFAEAASYCFLEDYLQKTLGLK